MVSDEGVGLAISLVQGSVDSLRSEVVGGMAAIGARLDTKMDKGDGNRITERLDRMERETDRRLTQVETQLRDEKTVADTLLGSRHKQWTFREHVWSTILAIATLIGLVFVEPWLASSIFAPHK